MLAVLVMEISAYHASFPPKPQIPLEPGIFIDKGSLHLRPSAKRAIVTIGSEKRLSAQAAFRLIML
jgi:hypothetical protein